MRGCHPFRAPKPLARVHLWRKYGVILNFLLKETVQLEGMRRFPFFALNKRIAEYFGDLGQYGRDRLLPAAETGTLEAEGPGG